MSAQLPAAATPVLTSSGLALRVRRLTSEEARRYQQVALMPYTWTNHRFAMLAGQSWQVRAGAALLAALAVWRHGTLWPVLACALLPTAVQRALELTLWVACIRRLPDYHRFAEFWDSGQNRLYGAFTDGEQLAGTVASLHLDPDACELQRLGVLESFRGHGIGEAMCRFLLSESATRRYRRVELGTTHLQTYAINIYERLGFVKIGEFRSRLLPGVPIYRYAIQLGERAAEGTQVPSDDGNMSK